MRPEPSLVSILTEREQDLRQELGRARATFRHSGERGVQLERTFRSFIESHLSSGFRVGHGEVFDLQGNRSRQTDVLVLNQYQPFRVPHDRPDAASFIVEGISVAGEIKATLTKSNLEETVQKGLAFRQVHSTSAVGDSYKNLHIEDAERFGISPPFFLFAYASEISDDSLFTALSRMPSVVLNMNPDGSPLVESPAIDAIFILDRNLSLLNSWQNSGNIRRAGEGSFPWAVKSRGLVVTGFLFWFYAVMLQPDRIIPPALRYFMQIMGEES